MEATIIDSKQTTTEVKQILVSVDDFEEAAKKKLTHNAMGYYSSGAGDESTLRSNRSSYEKLRIRPRILRDVSNRNYETEILNGYAKLPFGVCPTALQKLAHPDGEVANARAAEKAGIIFTLSTLASSSIEEIAAAAPTCIKWFQVYMFKNRELTLELVRRAKKAGFHAIVMTVDAQVLGIKRFEAKNGFIMPPNVKFSNLENESDQLSGIEYDFDKSFVEELDKSINWNDLRWLVENAKLPVLVKGVLTKEDAILAVRNGASGIIVSNHGGRQLNSTPATIEALPEIVDAVGGILPIIVDGGVRQGTDIFKALALGANMVFFGRPSLWGLAVDGQAGVEKLIEIYRTEFDNTMALAGCSKLSDIRKEMVTHENHYLKFQ